MCEYKELCEKITFGASENCEGKEKDKEECYPYGLIEVNLKKIYETK
jgi:hypothetical protein